VHDESWSDDASRAAAYGIHDLAQDALSALNRSEARRALRCLDTAAAIAKDYDFPLLSRLAHAARWQVAASRGHRQGAAGNASEHGLSAMPAIAEVGRGDGSDTPKAE